MTTHSDANPQLQHIVFPEHVHEINEPISSQVIDPLSIQPSTANAQLKTSIEQEKDLLIQSLSRALEGLTSSNGRLQIEIERRTISVQEMEQENANLESELVTETRRRMTAEMDVQRYRLADIQPGAPAPSEMATESTFCENIGICMNTVGSFCHRNENLFVAGIGLTGAICAGVFCPYAIPIALGVAAAIALFKWFTSYFN